MPGEMAFRKDCEECGRSFLTPDKKAKICQRCAGKGQPKTQPETVTRKGTSPKAAGKTKKSIGNSPTSGPADGPTSLVFEEIATTENEHEVTEPELQQAPQEKEKAGPKGAPPTPERKREEIELTPAQIQEIADRYQKYVRALERPPNGRRKTIAADMGLPIPERCPGPEAVESTAGSNRGFDPGRAFLHRKSLFFPSGRKKFLLGNQRSDRSRDRLEPLGGLPLSGPSS